MMLRRIVAGIGFLVIFVVPGNAQDGITYLKMLLLDDRPEELIRASDTLHLPDCLKDELHFYRGKAYQSLLKYDSALHCFSRAAELNSNKAPYRVAKAQMLARLGRSREAIVVYESLRKDTLAQHLAELAVLYSARNLHESSLKLYLQLLSRDSLNYYYLKQAGKSYQALNKSDSALILYRAAFKRNPADPFLTHQIANIYLKKKELDNAIFSIQRGFEYDTNNLDLLKLRGYIWLLIGNYQNAVWDLERARDLDTSSVFTWKYLGLSYHEHKMFDDSRESLMKAHILDSMDAETVFFLASAMRWSKHEEEAVDWYKKSIKIQQPDPEGIKDTYMQMAELLKVLHRFDEALECYDLALEYTPEDNTIYYKIGQLFDRHLDQKEEAIKYYEQYLHEGRTDQQLFDASEGTSTPMEGYVRNRIKQLKEELFFETEEK